MKNLRGMKYSKGFTLIELVVVVVILGILASVVLPALKGSTIGAKAVGLVRGADSANQVWTMLNQTCNVNGAVASNPLPNSGASRTVSDVIFGGRSMVAAAYQSCYDQSKVKALSEISQLVSAGVYSIQGFTVSFSGGGSAPLQVSYASVPDDLVLEMVQKYQPTLTALAASDNSNPTIQYGTATSGLRTVTIFKQ